MSDKHLYLTIDDSPTSKTEEILDFLISKSVPAVFFCRGDRLEEHPEIALKIINAGYTIGNHAFSHYHFSCLSIEQCFEEILKTHEVIKNLYVTAGIKDYPKVFRFPYGDKGDFKYGHHLTPFDQAFMQHQTKLGKLKLACINVIYNKHLSNKAAQGLRRKIQIQEYLHSLGYTSPKAENIQYTFLKPLLSEIDWPWSLDIGEWKYYGQYPSLKVFDQILIKLNEDKPYHGYGNICEEYGLSNPNSSEIILIHDHPEFAEIFKSAVQYLLDQGYKFKQPI